MSKHYSQAELAASVALDKRNFLQREEVSIPPIRSLPAKERLNILAPQWTVITLHEGGGKSQKATVACSTCGAERVLFRSNITKTWCRTCHPLEKKDVVIPYIKKLVDGTLELCERSALHEEVIPLQAGESIYIQVTKTKFRLLPIAYAGNGVNQVPSEALPPDTQATVEPDPNLIKTAESFVTVTPTNTPEILAASKSTQDAFSRHTSTLGPNLEMGPFLIVPWAFRGYLLGLEETSEALSILAENFYAKHIKESVATPTLVEGLDFMHKGEKYFYCYFQGAMPTITPFVLPE